MMDWPKPLSGPSSLGQWLNRFLGKAKTCTPLESKDFRIEFTSSGFFLRPKFQTSGQSSTPASIEVAAFCITQLLGADYFMANKLFNFTTTGGASFVLAQKEATPVVIAKQSAATRMLVGAEVIDGVKITYRAPGGSSPLIGYLDNNRIANDGTQDEVQCLYPRYVQLDDPTAVIIPGSAQINTAGLDSSAGLIWTGGQSVIYATQMTGGTGVRYPGPSPNVPVTWIETMPARVWAKRYIIPA